MRATILAVLATAAMLSGCASLTTYNSDRTYPVGGTHITFVDAKQRAIITAPPRQPGGPPIFCTEPSPDALSALAASQGLSFSNPSKVSVSEAASLSEAAGSIGLRTQSITLMRDAMFRICEGYASGAWSGATAETMFRRFQSSMVAIVAIEQLTGTVKAQQVVLGGSASTGNAQAVLDLTTRTSDARTAQAKAQADLSAAKATLDTDTKAQVTAQAAVDANTDTTKTAALAATLDKTKSATAADQAAVDTKTKAASDAADALKTVDAARSAVIASSNNTSASGSFAAASGAGTLSSDAIIKVADTVGKIVSDTENLTFSKELCTTVLLNADINRAAPEVAKSCLDYLQESVFNLRLYDQLKVAALKGEIVEEAQRALLARATAVETAAKALPTAATNAKRKKDVAVDDKAGRAAVLQKLMTEGGGNPLIYVAPQGLINSSAFLNEMAKDQALPNEKVAPLEAANNRARKEK